MTKNILFSRPAESDFTEAMNFFEVVIRHTFEKNELGYMTEEIESEINHKREMLLSDFETKGETVYFLLGKLEGEIVASISLGTVGHLILECTGDSLSNLYEVGTVFVKPCFQGQGIGSYMMNLIQRELVERKQDSYCFDSGYPSAQRVWTKHFGKAQHIQYDFWGKDSHHMIWHLGVNFNPNKILPILE